MSLTVLITSPTLGIRRCSADEADAAWVPEGIWFESVTPGGWKGAGFNLRQRIDQDLGLRLLDEVEFIDEDGNTVYEGLIVKLPRQHGDDFLLGVECLGFAATMLFDTSVPYFYVDRDLSHWHEMPLSRKVTLAAASTPMGKIQYGVNEGGLSWEPPNEAISDEETAELHYDCGAGLECNYFGYQGARTGAFTGFEAPTLLNGTGSGLGGLTLDNLPHEGSPSSPSRTLALRLYLSGGPQTPAAGHLQRYTKVAVWGNHSVPATAVSGDLSGVTIDAVLVDALSAACPKLSVATVANGGLVEHPDIVVAHAADTERGTVERIVLDLNKYVLFEWGVYHQRRFFYRETNQDRLCWEARLDKGIHLSLEGDDAEHALNGMLVRYQLSDGTARVAGPTGSGLDVESDLLVDTDPENSVNAHGYEKKWGELSISFPLAADLYATVIGSAYLAQSALPSRAGNIELVGEIEHPTKGFRPVREVLAGDWIRLSDHPADVPRRIISARYDDDQRKCTVTVGNDMDRVDAILEQVGVKTRLTSG